MWWLSPSEPWLVLPCSPSSVASTTPHSISRSTTNLVILSFYIYMSSIRCSRILMTGSRTSFAHIATEIPLRLVGASFWGCCGCRWAGSSSSLSRRWFHGPSSHACTSYPWVYVIRAIILHLMPFISSWHVASIRLWACGSPHGICPGSRTRACFQLPRS